MELVQCRECEAGLKSLSSGHLKKHGMTFAEYREKYPTARLLSAETRKRISRRQLNRNCVDCGRPFTTGCTKARYCPECQRVRYAVRNRENAKRYQSRLRNSGKIDVWGTFGKKYLETVNGRIRGAMLLEKHISINGHGFYMRRVHFEYEISSLVIRLSILCERFTFCVECGSRLTVVRENGNYTIPAEVCCENCGLVYEEELIPPWAGFRRYFNFNS